MYICNNPVIYSSYVCRDVSSWGRLWFERRRLSHRVHLWFHLSGHNIPWYCVIRWETYRWKQPFLLHTYFLYFLYLKPILLVIILCFHWSKMCRLFSVLPLSVTIILPQIFRSKFDRLDCKQTHQQILLFQFLSISVFSQWILGHVVFKRKRTCSYQK